MSPIHNGETAYAFSGAQMSNNEDDATLKEIAESIANSVWKNPHLTLHESSDEEEDSDIEILDPDLINPDVFDWQAHEDRIKRLFSHCIRSYVRSLNKPTGVIKEVQPEDSHLLERETDFIRREYRKIFERMRQSKCAKRVLKIRKLRQTKMKKERKLLHDQIRRERERLERRMELEMEAENVVEFWIGSMDPNKTMSAVHVAEKIVDLHIEQMEKFMERRDRMFDLRSMVSEKITRKSVDTQPLVYLENKMDLRMNRHKRKGSRFFLIVTLLKKWLKKKLISVKKLRSKDAVCKRCLKHEAIWRSYRREYGYVEPLTIEDGRKFFSMLVHNGEMRILIDYFKILLSKPTKKIEYPLNPAHEESAEDDVIDLLIGERNNEHVASPAEECLLCSSTCERRAIPWLCNKEQASG